jgi:hypothetical protein
MKPIRVLFLDFDGVLNSRQEIHYYDNRAKRLLRIRIRDFLCWLSGRIQYRTNKNGWTEPRRLPGPLKRLLSYLLLSWFSDHENFCPIACSNVQYLLNEVPNLKIVVSSTWRLHGIKRCRRVLKRNGIDVSRVIDVTPRGCALGCDTGGIPGDWVPGRCGRGHQIEKWLRAHPEVESFVIVDDDSDMDHLYDRLVQTNHDEGFMFRHALTCLGAVGRGGQMIEPIDDRTCDCSGDCHPECQEG